MTAVWEQKNARKRDTGKKDTKENPFVRYELTDEQKKDLRERVASGWDIFEVINLLIQAGYKISITWDDYTNSPACFFFPKEPTNPNFGAILSGRVRTAQGALYEAAYKHFYVFDTVWGRSTAKTDDQFWDD